MVLYYSIRKIQGILLSKHDSTHSSMSGIAVLRACADIGRLKLDLGRFAGQIVTQNSMTQTTVDK